MSYKVYATNKTLQRKLFFPFLKHSVLNDLTEDTIDDGDSYLPYEEIFLGFLTKKLLQKNFNESVMTLTQQDKFINAVIPF